MSIFRRLTTADVVRLERLIEDTLEQVKLLREQHKGLRGRVQKAEGRMRDAVEALMSRATPPTIVDEYDEEPEAEVQANGFADRLNLPRA